MLKGGEEDLEGEGEGAGWELLSHSLVGTEERQTSPVVVEVVAEPEN